jgi:hypothetical protein
MLISLSFSTLPRYDIIDGPISCADAGGVWDDDDNGGSGGCWFGSVDKVGWCVETWVDNPAYNQNCPSGNIIQTPCSAVGVGYVNNCDSTDLCGNVRNTNPFNSCDINANITCGIEVDCDGIDNDCDGNIDNGPVMECALGESGGSVSDPVYWICNNSCEAEFYFANSSPQIEGVGPFYFDNVLGSYPKYNATIGAYCNDTDGNLASCVFEPETYCQIYNLNTIQHSNSEIYLFADLNCGDSRPTSYYRDYITTIRATDTQGGVGTSQIIMSIRPVFPNVGNQTVDMFNTIPLGPIFNISSPKEIVNNSITLDILNNYYDPDVFSGGNQTLRYGIKSNDSSPTFDSSVFSTSRSITVNSLDANIENCFYAKIFDGLIQSNSTKTCIPQINNLSIANFTPGGVLNNTKWVRNHVDASDYETLKCIFSLSDSDVSDTINYSVSLMAKDPDNSLVPIEVETKHGAANNLDIIGKNFIVGKYPGQEFNYKVGTRFYCDVDVNDGFLINSKSLYSGPNTWVPKGAWDNDTNVSTEYIELVNSPPYYPGSEINIEYVDRFLDSHVVQAEIKDVNDVDNYPGDPTQYFSYEGKIHKDFESIVVPDDFVGPIAFNPKKFEIPLFDESNYCFLGRASDSLEWSNVTPELCSNENPFQPSCSALSSPRLNVVLVKSEVVDGNLVNELDISCNRSSRINDTWFINVKGSDVKFNNLPIASTSSEINDCNTTPQKLIVSIDSNQVGNYEISFTYGGTFNSETIYCSQSLFTTLSTGNDFESLNIPDNNFMLIILFITIISLILIPKKD